MHQLITLSKNTINQQMVQTVNARELHGFLQSKQDFSTWIKSRIADYDFVENQDFIIAREVIAPQKNGAEKSMTYANWQGKIDYHITLDMAKELSMVERNEQGKMARRYFIECEKQLKQAHAGIDVKKCQMELLNILTANPILSDVAKQTLLITTAEKIMGVSLDYRPQLEQTTYSAKEIGEKLGISANKVGRLTNEHNLKTDEFGRYVLDKSASSVKQVETFRYFDSVIPVLKALLASNH